MFLTKLKRSYFACLSTLILAICSLMLPIEGHCGWTYMDEGYSSFSDSSYESHGGGWTLSGSVSAAPCCASASMGPSIENHTAFSGALDQRVADYTGNAYVEASREEVTVEEYVLCEDSVCTEFYGYVHAHWERRTYPAETDTGDGDFLQAWVLMVKEESMNVYGVAKSDPSLTLTINVSIYDERANVGAQWTSGGITYTTQSSTKITKVIPQIQPSESANAHVSGRVEASKSASVYYISFASNSYDSADASYSTFGE